MTRLDRSTTATTNFLTLTDRELLEHCEVDLYRASGPGGQKRNKTSSAVRLRHVPTGLSVTASEDRSQHVNRRRALRRLRMAIAWNVRREIDAVGYKRSELLETCIGSRQELRIGRRDARYSEVVAEVLDVLVSCGMSVKDAADRFGLPTAQLVKFLRNDPKLWQRTNELRASAGLQRLR